jgi:hypothetical protein
MSAAAPALAPKKQKAPRAPEISEKELDQFLPELKKGYAKVPVEIFTVLPRKCAGVVFSVVHQLILRTWGAGFDTRDAKMEGGRPKRAKKRLASDGKTTLRPEWAPMPAPELVDVLRVGLEAIQEALRDADKMGLIETRSRGLINCYRVRIENWEHVPDRDPQAGRIGAQSDEDSHVVEDVEPDDGRLVLLPGQRSARFQLSDSVHAVYRNESRFPFAQQVDRAQDGNVKIKILDGPGAEAWKPIDCPPADGQSKNSTKRNQRVTAILPPQKPHRSNTGNTSGPFDRTLTREMIERSFRSLGAIPEKILDQVLELQNGAPRELLARRLRGKKAADWTGVLELLGAGHPRDVDPRFVEMRDELNKQFAESFLSHVPNEIVAQAITAIGSAPWEQGFEKAFRRLRVYRKRGEDVSWALIPMFFDDVGKLAAQRKSLPAEKREIPLDPATVEFERWAAARGISIDDERSYFAATELYSAETGKSALS